MASAEDVGKKLLGEVEEYGLDDILNELRLQDRAEKEQYFKFHHLDRLLHTLEDTWPSTSNNSTLQPIVEFMSLGPGGGTTHILYYLCAIAVLPHVYRGKQESAVIIDTDGKFSIPRLTAQIQLLLRRNNSVDNAEERSDQDLRGETLSALKHIHLFRPQSLATTIATVDSLPDYLFNQDRHYSFDREVAFIALDSASAFHWQDRSETENAAFLAKTTNTNGSSQTSAYFKLATSLKLATTTLNCAGVFTTWYLGPQQRQRDGAMSRSFRQQIPTLPASLRLVAHRLPVRKFPPGLSVDGALREAQERQKAVAEARFECFVNEWNLDERLLRSLSGSSFGFRILSEGLLVEEANANDLNEE